MKQLKCIIKSFILISLIVSLSSCEMISGMFNKADGGKDVDRTKVGDTKQFLRFRPDGASALGVVDKEEGPNASARNAATNELILKITEAGSMESFLTLPEGTQGELADILMITQSPNPETKCFFVILNGYSWLTTPVTKTDEDGNDWVENQRLIIGPLLCVFDDGSYCDVFPDLLEDETFREWAAEGPENTTTFDKQGNLYYVINERDNKSNPSVIYKYDPTTNTTTQLTAKIENLWYNKLQVSGDGEWFFANAHYNGGASYLRAIPVNDPENPINFWYDSTGDSWLKDWVYDDDAECFYYSSNGAVHKIPKVNGTFSKANDVVMFSGSGTWFITDKDNGLFDESTESIDTFTLNDSYKNTPVGRYLKVYKEDDATGELKDTGTTALPKEVTYLFKNITSEEKEIQPQEIYNYIINNAFSSLEKPEEIAYFIDKGTEGAPDYVFKPGLDEKYYLSFKKFENDKVFGKIAEVTKDKKNVEAIKAIFDNNLENLFGSLIYSEGNNSIYKNAGSSSVQWYERNFYADVLYSIDTDEPIEEDLFLYSDIKTDCFATPGFSELAYINLYKKNTGPVYTWKAAYKDGDSVDAKKVLEKLSSLCRQDEIDFKLTAFKGLKYNYYDFSPLYTEKTNEDAIKFLDEPAKLQLLYNYITSCCNDFFVNGNGKFLNVTCFKKGTDETAYTLKDPNVPQIWWDGITNFTPSYQKSLYGSDKEGFVEIVDKDGKDKGERITLEGSPKLHIVSTVSSDNGVYFLNAVDDGKGGQTGKHNVIYYDATTGTLTNLFEKVTNGDQLEVISFSGGNNALYFNAFKGFTVISGKIDTTTGTYSELGSGDKLSKLIVVR